MEAKERFKPAENCSSKTLCRLMGRCFKSSVILKPYPEILSERDSLWVVEHAAKQFGCDSDEVRGLEFKVKIAKYQDKLHPSRRLR